MSLIEAKCRQARNDFIKLVIVAEKFKQARNKCIKRIKRAWMRMQARAGWKRRPARTH